MMPLAPTPAATTTDAASRIRLPSASTSDCVTRPSAQAIPAPNATPTRPPIPTSHTNWAAAAMGTNADWPARTVNSTMTTPSLSTASDSRIVPRRGSSLASWINAMTLTGSIAAAMAPSRRAAGTGRPPAAAAAQAITRAAMNVPTTAEKPMNTPYVRRCSVGRRSAWKRSWYRELTLAFSA